jgi:hypothetical protein
MGAGFSIFFKCMIQTLSKITYLSANKETLLILLRDRKKAGKDYSAGEALKGRRRRLDLPIQCRTRTWGALFKYTSERLIQGRERRCDFRTQEDLV